MHLTRARRSETSITDVDIMEWSHDILLPKVKP